MSIGGLLPQSSCERNSSGRKCTHILDMLVFSTIIIHVSNKLLTLTERASGSYQCRQCSPSTIISVMLGLRKHIIFGEVSVCSCVPLSVWIGGNVKCSCYKLWPTFSCLFSVTLSSAAVYITVAEYLLRYYSASLIPHYEYPSTASHLGTDRYHIFSTILICARLVPVLFFQECAVFLSGVFKSSRACILLVFFFFERRPRRSPNRTQPDFAMCSDMSQIWKYMSIWVSALKRWA